MEGGIVGIGRRGCNARRRYTSFVDPALSFGKFVLGRRLGAGGMGEVFEARDTQLDRVVAIKFLKGDEPEELARFKREAQVAGKLVHPNIAAVYEVGEAAGRHFIAMQFIDGTTLKAWKGSARDAAALIAVAARAVGYAHDQGVVHRDLKPDNLMIDRRRRLFVMDFGLARGVAGSQISVSGDIVGTPSYMSPEQSRGGRVDARADIWSLGATLYDLVARRAPFRGSNVYDTVKLVQETEPPPLRTDRDLATIVAKCMEKEPARRYATAEALADDLEAFGRGDPISARPVGTATRLARTLGRRRSVLAAAAAGLIVAAAAGGWIAMRTRHAESGTAEAQAALVESMRRTAATNLAAALEMRRAGNLPAMDALIEQVRAACARVLEKQPRSAEPHLHLARMLHARMLIPQAALEASAAVELDPGLVEARYERLVLNSHLLHRRIIKLTKIAVQQDPDPDAPSRASTDPAPYIASDPEAMSLQRKIEEDAAVVVAAAARLSAAQLASARAWSALVRNDYKTSLREWSQALANEPGLEDARIGLIDLHMYQLRHREAIALCTEGIRLDAGQLMYREARASAAVNFGIAQAALGEDPTALYTLALGDHEFLASVGFAGEKLTLRHGTARAALADWRRTTRQDAAPDYTAALRDYDAWIAEHPDEGEGYVMRGLTRLHFYLLPPADRSLRDGGFADLARAAELLPLAEEPWYYRGTSLILIGRMKGEDLFECLREAVSCLERSLSLSILRDRSWSALAEARLALAFESDRRGTPLPDQIELAIQHCDRLLDLRRNLPGAFLLRGRGRCCLARLEARQGRDPLALIKASLADYELATRGAPKHAAMWEHRAIAEAEFGVIGRRFGRSDAELIAAAIESYTRAIAIDPGADSCYAARADLHAMQQRFDAAARDYDEAIRRNANRFESWAGRATLRTNIAMRGAAEQDTTAQFAAADEDFDRALKLKPDDAPIWAARGYARLQCGVMTANVLQKDPTSIFKEAETHLQKSLQLDAKNGTAWGYRGDLWFSIAQVQQAQHVSGASALKNAQACYRKAVQFDAGLEARLRPTMERVDALLKRE